MRNRTRIWFSVAAGWAMGVSVCAGGDLDGRWAARLITSDGVEIPFRLDIGTRDGQLVGTLYNGKVPQTTSSAAFRDGQLRLNFEHYLTAIQARLEDGELRGELISLKERTGGPGPQANLQYAGSESRGNAYRRGPTWFRAKRYVASGPRRAENVPNIAGFWEIPQETPKGEKSWRLVIDQQGAEIQAAILRIDGDTGALTGEWQDGKFVASHFDGSRPGLIVLTPQPDGTLHVKLHAVPRILEALAYRPEVARAKGLPEPSNFLTHTTVRDPDAVFTYAFPDVNGKVITHEDPIVKGKVVVAVVTGTWCPNCHDEAQFLVELQKQYGSRGLQVIALDFEEEDQLNSLTRVRAFIKKYGVPYPYLIAGTPAEMWDKIPQAVNLNSWPTTFFIGRDGKVKAVHAGFAGPASGPFHTALKAEFTSVIEKLLKEPAPAETVTSAAVR